MTQSRDPKRIKTSPPTWRTEVANHYAQLNLSPDVHEDFSEKLLSFNLNEAKVPLNAITADNDVKLNKALLVGLPLTFNRIHRSGFGYLFSVAAAALVTFGIMSSQQEVTLDPIVELANQAGPKALPADFDLEGDPSSIAEFMQEVFPKQEFMLSQLPKEVISDYRPSEGRFFTWSGQPGVSIQLVSTTTKQENGATTLLYIVQLGESNSKGFPKEQKITRNYVSKAGKQKRVKAWRDEKFGYAMVQSAAVNDELYP